MPLAERDRRTLTIGGVVIGVLLVSALMVVPVATAQLFSRSFRGTALVGMVLGVAVAVAGVVVSFHADTPSGGTIVVLAIAVFLLALAATGVRRAVTARSGA